MSLVFQQKPVAKIQATLTGTKKLINIDGVTAGETSPDNAAAQINTILDIVGQSVGTTGMKRILTEEVVDSE